MQVAGRALPFEPLAVAHPIFAIDPVDLLRCDPVRLERRPSHGHCALEEFPLGEGDVEPIELDHVHAVERAHHDGGLRKRIEDGLDCRPAKLTAFVVVAKGDHPRCLGARRS